MFQAKGLTRRQARVRIAHIVRPTGSRASNADFMFINLSPHPLAERPYRERQRAQTIIQNLLQRRQKTSSVYNFERAVGLLVVVLCLET